MGLGGAGGLSAFQDEDCYHAGAWEPVRVRKPCPLSGLTLIQQYWG